MGSRTPSAALGSDVIIYGGGNVVVAALNFGLFAVYAHHLRPADYGAMSLIVTACAGVSMFGMIGMNNAVQRFFFEEKNETAQRRVWGSGFVGGLVLTSVLAALVAFAFQFFDRSVPELAGSAAVIAFATIIPQTVVVWLQDRARLQFSSWRYVSLALLQATVAGVAGVYFVAQRGDGVRGFFVGAAIGAIIAALVAVFTAPRFLPVVFSRGEFRRLITFGAPFVPAGIAIWASTTALRWELVQFKNLEAAGIFDVAWKLSAPVWMLNTAVGQAFGPFAFRLQAEDPDYRAKLVDLFHLLGGATLLVTCALILFAPELCALVAPPAYAAAALPCGILALAFYFSALQQVTALGIAFSQRSRLIGIGWSLAAFANIAFACLMVPAFGAAGAAGCLLLMHAGLNIFYLWHSQRLHPLPFRITPMAVQTIAGLGTVAGAVLLEGRGFSGAAIGLKLLGLLAVSAIVIAWGGVDAPRTRRAISQWLDARRVRS